MLYSISDGYLSFKGRIFGRFRLMWEDLRPIVEEGMLIDAGKQLRYGLLVFCFCNIDLRLLANRA